MACMLNEKFVHGLKPSNHTTFQDSPEGFSNFNSFMSLYSGTFLYNTFESANEIHIGNTIGGGNNFYNYF